LLKYSLAGIGCGARSHAPCALQRCPDKTPDFEQIIAKRGDALRNSADPQRRQQADGWKVMRVMNETASHLGTCFE
jgi:hypothetical protein